jgi:hypothetical protein
MTTLGLGLGLSEASSTKKQIRIVLQPIYIQYAIDDHTKNLTVRPVTLKSRLPKTLKTIPRKAGHPNKGSLRP